MSWNNEAYGGNLTLTSVIWSFRHVFYHEEPPQTPTWVGLIHVWVSDILLIWGGTNLKCILHIIFLSNDHVKRTQYRFNVKVMKITCLDKKTHIHCLINYAWDIQYSRLSPRNSEIIQSSSYILKFSPDLRRKKFLN